MSLPTDFNKTLTVTIGFLILIATVGFYAGYLYKGMQDQTNDILSAREYTKQEVDGLRADWERDREEQERRLIKLEDEINR